MGSGIALADERPGADAGPRELADWLRDHGPVVALTGAGMSTESGIPDYRGETGRSRVRAPMTWQVFRADPEARRRYWARSHLGWQLMSKARPNDGQRALRTLQEHGLLATVITQNVDGLHDAAGVKDVIELHGSIHRVRCLDCEEVTPRADLEARLRNANPGWTSAGPALADGDAEIDEAAVGGFSVVPCRRCGGILKPDVVFFGETVPAERVEAGFAAVEGAAGLLVLGSSLAVMSGYRFVLRAARAGIAVAIVNQGPTRGDDRAGLRVDAPLGATLRTLTAGLEPS